MTSDVTYRVRPYVCGAIGRWDATTLRRLKRLSPIRLRQIHSSPTLVLLASAKLTPWRTSSRRGFLWGSLADGGTPGSWRHASDERLAAGVEIADDSAVLHTDGLGIHDVFLRRLGGAVYFSVRLEPLVDLDDSPVSTDWAAWANILSVTSPLGDQTPFQEIRRLPAFSGLRVTADGTLTTVTYEPAWFAVEPRDSASPADVIDVLRSVIDGPRAVVPLSGGWDSRLLAMLLAERGVRTEAWTTSKDDGFDWDVDLSIDVARALNLPQRIVAQSDDAWLVDRTVVRERLSYRTTHHAWMRRLARELHRDPGPVFDGLAGDVFFHPTWRTEPPDRSAGRSALLQHMWDTMAESRLRADHLFAPGAARVLRQLARETFDAVIEPFLPHHDYETVGHMVTRTALAIAPSTQWLFEPEVATRLPFIHPTVMACAMTVAPARKINGEFFREMMAVVNPTVGALPSTNDELPRRQRGLIRHRSYPALRAIAAEVRADEVVLSLLAPEMRFLLRDTGGLEMVGRSMPGSRLLQWLSLLAAWRAKYAGRLKDDGGLLAAHGA